MKCFINGNAQRRTHNAERVTYGARKLYQLCVLSSVLCVMRSLAWACPTCKDSLGEGMARGFYWSILWMLSVVAVVVSSIAGLVWWSSRQKEALPDSHHGQSS